jgi:hypothetical protein
LIASLLLTALADTRHDGLSRPNGGATETGGGPLIEIDLHLSPVKLHQQAFMCGKSLPCIERARL